MRSNKFEFVKFGVCVAGPSGHVLRSQLNT